MTIVQLKNILIDKISGIDDKSFLLTINSIIEANSTSFFYKTNCEQRKKNVESREQIANCNVLIHEEVQKEIDKWLNENSLVL